METLKREYLAPGIQLFPVRQNLLGQSQVTCVGGSDETNTNPVGCSGGDTTNQNCTCPSNAESDEEEGGAKGHSVWSVWDD